MNKSAELAYWINERHAMKLRKEDTTGFMGDWKHGWSDNPHMGLVRYCNVHREDDKVTKWLAKNWRPNHHAIWEIVLARMINYIPSLDELLTRTNVEGTAYMAKILKERRGRGDKVFTSAYTISTCGQSMDKIDYVMEVVQRSRELEENGGQAGMAFRRGIDRSLESAHRQLTQVDGLGNFLAAQVIADLKNTAGHPLQAAPDWHTWSAPGPGSLKGLCEYFGSTVTPGNYQAAIKLCREQTMPLVDPMVPPIHMQDFQNCLCEFSKFERVKSGGHVRNKYRPG